LINIIGREARGVRGICREGKRRREVMDIPYD
jgi:hypothetical protein